MIFCETFTEIGFAPCGTGARAPRFNTELQSFSGAPLPHAYASECLHENAEDPEKLSDQELIESASRGANDSFARLVERYQAAVAATLWRFTRDKLVLEELVQDTFVEVYLSLRSFRKGAPFFPWLRTVATRVGYRHWRVLRREAERRELAARHRLPESANASETADYVFAVLEHLAPEDRLVLTLQYFDGCSIKEIAERMGWSATLVKVRSFRARQKLRNILTKAEELS
jgi:RNA polymerase sigma-70 factor (ECF subfamily)